MKEIGFQTYVLAKNLISEIPDLPIYFFTLIICLALYLIFIKGSKNFYLDELEDFINEDREENEYFRRLGKKMTANKYRLYLYGISALIFIAMGAKAAAEASISGLILAIMTTILIAYIFRPVRYVFSDIESPFYRVICRISKNRSAELDRELYNSVTLLKNMAIAQEREPLSGDMIMEKLMENSKKLKPVFADMMTVYRQGDKSRALKNFANSVGTKNAATFAQTLEKVDKTSPTELKIQITALQESMSDERFTRGLEKAEKKGTALFTLATVVCFICLLNFIFVCVLMDAMEMLGEMI